MAESRKILFNYEGETACVEIESEITLEQLKQIACDVLDLHFDIDLQIFDNSFNEWVKCLSVLSVQNMQRIKIKRKFVDSPYQDDVGQFINTPVRDVPEEKAPNSSSLSTPVVVRCSGNLLIRTFEVPEFSRKVLAKLKNGDRLNRADRTSILEKFYDAIVPYSLYPTSTEYRHIAAMFLAKFPTLYSHVGYSLALEQWKSSIIYKFQNTRKNDKSVSNLPQVIARRIKRTKLNLSIKNDFNSVNVVAKKYKVMWDFQNYLPPRLEGSTAELICKHLAFLKSESCRGRPDYRKVTSSMLATLSDRRMEIVDTGLSVKDVVNKYHFLSDEDDIILEFSRISGKESDSKLDEKLMNELKKLTIPMLKITTAFVIKDHRTKSCVQKYCESRTEEDLDRYKLPCSVFLLLLLLKEKASNIFVKEESADSENLNSFISYCGEIEEIPSDIKVHIDGHTVKCTTLAKSLAVYLAVHIVFNIQYSKYNIKFLTFIEKYCADIISLLPTPKTVLHIQRKIIEATCYEK